jgi:hypothetical protein
VLGDCLFDSIRTALVMRKKCCDLTLLRPVPRNAHDLRIELCNFALANRNVPLPYGEAQTPAEVVEQDYVQAAEPLRDPVWERCEGGNDRDSPPPFAHQNPKPKP